MECLWSSPRSKRTLFFAALGVVCLAVLTWSSVTVPSRIPLHAPLSQTEMTLRGAPSHNSEFSPVSPALAPPKCAKVRPPEALLTPDPLLDIQDDDLSVRVSFIVGSDGNVHSAFVLDSGGPDEDQIVLRAIRFWRYRPALCNGVPTDSEALVRFSLH